MADTSRRPKTLTARCACGTVALEATGDPIVAAACYCTSCRTAGAQFEALSNAPKLLDPFGGTECLLYRRDRVSCTSGEDRLQEFRLSPDSPTHRFVATCCNTAMVLDFKPGHWLTLFRTRFSGEVPPIAMRLNTENLPPDVRLPQDVPVSKRASARFILKLVGAKIAMLLGR